MSDETMIDAVDDEAMEAVYARHVLVPVANPATAWNLLRLGALLAHPDGGEVIALNVMVSGVEDERAVRAQTTLSELVERLALAGMPVRWLSVTAISPARGILDAAREEGADLVVLGYYREGDGPVLGPVVEAVARTTPSDLVVYRVEADPEVQRILLPADGSANARVAARLAVLLSELYHAPITAAYVQVGYARSPWSGMARIAATLNGLPGAEVAERKVIQAGDVAAGILSEAGPQDLVLLGFSEQSQFDRWLYGNVPQQVLRHAPGPVILTKDAISTRSPLKLRARQWLAGLSPRLTPAEQEALRQQASDMARPNINFFVLVVLSCLIASLGLLQNSPAVIIGAMLVAPLMSPLLAFAVGLVIGELRLMQSAATSMTKGIAWALGIAVAVSLLSPITKVTAEMAARGQPSLLDMGVALASGAAGAYATGRRDVPAALAGVAIAAALMPPLCTVGLAAAFADWEVAGGALLLFATNIVSICLAGAVVFRWLGIKPSFVRPDGGRPWRQRMGILAVVVLLLALPLALGLLQIAAQETDVQTVYDVLESAWGESEDLELVQVEMDRDSGETLRVRVTVWATGELTAEEVAQVEARLSERLGQPASLEVAVVQVMHAP